MNNGKQNKTDCFVWGVASASFQIEGAYNEDGKGLSIWDVFTHEPSRTKKGNTGDIACDHYHRYKEDVKLMAELGVKGYRFSISWSRIMPKGYGEVNAKGIEFYRSLIDELLANGIEPYVTLYHWDLPQALYELGGWLNPNISDMFAAYAEIVGKAFGDKVKNFITINEASNVLEGMSQNATNAPGHHYSLRDRLTALHNILKAHGKAVIALRKFVDGVKIGFAPCSGAICPVDADSEAQAEEAYFKILKGDLKGNSTIRLFYDTIFFGDYPKEYYEYYSDIMPNITKEDLEIISQPIDYCFHNIYSGRAYGAKTERVNPVCNMLGWNIYPEAIYFSSKYLYKRYRCPIMITENGYPSPDFIFSDGCVHDPARIEFIRRYTDEMQRAISEDVDIRGYFYWTIMDNLEWELGFEPRFGLIYVDFDTLERTPKDSYYFYKQLIENSDLKI